MAQIARPTSDVAAGGWGTTEAALYAAIDEVSANDADYIFWDGASGPDPAVVGLAALTDPASSAGHEVPFRAWVGGGASAADLTVTLLQGTTPIANTLVSLSGFETAFTLTLSGAEADAITDYAALRLRFLGENLVGLGWVAVSHAYLTVPDAPPVALAATGSGTSAGTATLSVRRGLAATGAGGASGAADLTVTSETVVDLAASGAGAATGQAALGLRRELAATGAGAATGTADLTVLTDSVVALAASGAGAASGVAMLGVMLALAASGAGGSTGSAALDVVPEGAADARVVVGPQARVAVPTADLSPLIALTASGVGVATGAADLTVTSETVVDLAASGAGAATGQAALGLRRELAATGAGAATGTADLTITAEGFVALAASGLGEATGSAALSLRLALAASGSGSASGVATLAVRDALQVPSDRGYPHVTLWSDYPWSSGTPTRRLAAVIDWEERHAIEEFLVTHQLTARLPTAWEGTALLTPGGILQVVRRPGEVRWYEIQDLTDGLGDGGITSVQAYGAEYGLATAGQVPSTSSVATVGAALQHILDACPVGVTLGAVTPGAVLIEPAETAFAGASPGAALRLVAEAVRNRTGLTYEISVTAAGSDGRDGLAVHLTQFGMELPTIDLPYGTALTGIRRTRTNRSSLTRAHDPPAGLGDLGGTGPEASWWLVTAVDAGAGTIDVTALGGGLGPAIEDGQWGGSAYALRTPTGVLRTIITSTVVTPETTRFTLASTTGMTVNARVPLLLVAGTPPVDVRLPSIEALGGRPVLRPTASGADRGSNLSRNPRLASWLAGAPVGMGGSNVVQSLAAGTWETGGSSAELRTSGSGASLRESLTLHVAVDTTVTYVIRYMIASAVAGVTNFEWWDPESGTTKVEPGTLRPRGVFQSWSQSVRCVAGVHTLEAKIANAELVDIGGVPTYVMEQVYVDAWGILLGGTAWVVGSGPARAIQHANLQFATHGRDQVSYDVTPLNLAKSDPDGAGKYRTLRLGAAATIIGRGLGIRDTVRVLEHVEPGRGIADSLTLSTRAALLSQTLARRL